MFMNLLSLLTCNGSKSKDSKLHEFVCLLTEPHDERRSHERTPCFRSLTIYTDAGMGPIPATLRDISEKGVGLVHEVPLQLGEVMLRIPIEGARAICARVDIAWCRAPMKHCYISGGPFIDVFIVDPVTLLD
jgi:hypothetical protein